MSGKKEEKKAPFVNGLTRAHITRVQKFKIYYISQKRLEVNCFAGFSLNHTVAHLFTETCLADGGDSQLLHQPLYQPLYHPLYRWNTFAGDPCTGSKCFTISLVIRLYKSPGCSRF